MVHTLLPATIFVGKLSLAVVVRSFPLIGGVVVTMGKVFRFVAVHGHERMA